jgi:perosamine synthetase
MNSEDTPFYVPWITRADKKSVLEALDSRWLTGGPKAVNFERLFANYVGVKHAISVDSCTAALHLSMRALDIKAGDEVIVPVLTFAATANAPIFCGAKPVFVDIDERTFNINPKDILEKISPRTKAIIPVHYAGQACDMREISEIAKDHKLFVVEDCAHSLGSEYGNTKTGNFGIMGCFSFYPTKIITTFEGGMVTTNDEKIDKRLRTLREHGMTRTAIDRELNESWYYDVCELGYNYRLSEPQAALGITQLARIDEGIKRRKKVADFYTDRLGKYSDSGLVPPFTAPNRSHIFHLYTIRIKKESGITRNKVFKKLSGYGIQSSVHYTPLHLMSFYKQFLTKGSCTFPVAERIYEEILSLPIYPTMTKKTMASVATKTIESFNSNT